MIGEPPCSCPLQGHLLGHTLGAFFFHCVSPPVLLEILRQESVLGLWGVTLPLYGQKQDHWRQGAPPPDGCLLQVFRYTSRVAQVDQGTGRAEMVKVATVTSGVLAGSLQTSRPVPWMV